MNRFSYVVFFLLAAMLCGTGRAQDRPAGVPRQWSTGKAMPTNVKFHATAAVNGAVYVFGGSRQVGDTWYYNNNVLKYDVAANTWATLGQIPFTGMNNALTAVVGDKIYILDVMYYAGDPVQINVVREAYEYDPANGAFTKKAAAPKLQAFSTLGVIDDKIYVIGGLVDGAFSQTVQVYDPATDTWSEATDFPENVAYSSAATVNNSIVVTGGLDFGAGDPFFTSHTYVGTMENGTLVWKRGADYPIGPAAMMSGVGLGSSAYFFAGSIPAGNDMATISYTLQYTPDADKWTWRESKPASIRLQRQAVTDGMRIYAPGGELPSSAASNSIEIFDPTEPNYAAATVTPLALEPWVKRGDEMKTGIVVVSEGPLELLWSAVVDPSAAAWLSLETMNGTLGPYDFAQLPIRVNAAMLPSGNYTGSITVTTNDVDNPSYVIQVTAHVQDENVDTEANILIEQFTGTWVPYTPWTEDTLQALKAIYGDRLSVITYHNGDAMSTATGNLLAQALGLANVPTAAINRAWFGDLGGRLIGRNSWRDAVSRIAETSRSPVTISIKDKFYGPTYKQIEFNAEIFFHQTIAEDLRLMVVQTNDRKNFAQAKGILGTDSTEYLFPYYHDDVAQWIVPDENGWLISGGQHLTQTTATQNVQFTSVDSLPAASNLTLIVYRAGSGEILQSYREPLLAGIAGIGDRPVAGMFELHQNFPNPFGPLTTIAYSLPATSQVTLIVTDALGRTVATLAEGLQEAGVHTINFDGADLNPGNYFVTMRTGDFVQTRTMTLMK